MAEKAAARTQHAPHRRQPVIGDSHVLKGQGVAQAVGDLGADHARKPDKGGGCGQLVDRLVHVLTKRLKPFKDLPDRSVEIGRGIGRAGLDRAGLAVLTGRDPAARSAAVNGQDKGMWVAVHVNTIRIPIAPKQVENRTNIA